MFKSGFRHIRRHPYVTSAIFIVLIVIAVFLFARGGNETLTRTVTVTRGNIAQTVIVTGKTKPKQDINLGFEKSGVVATVHVEVGDPVRRGAPLVAQDTRELRTALDQATANKSGALAKLEALRRGLREEDIQIARTALQKAQQDFTNILSGVPDIIHSAYSKSDDAVRKQLDPLFLNDDRTNATLSFETNSSQTATDAGALRAAAGTELSRWNDELAAITSSTPSTTLEDMLLKSRMHLTIVRALLDKTMNAIVGAASSLSDSTALTYKSYVATGRTNVDAALSSVNEEFEYISAQKIAASKAQDELNLKLAGSDPQDVIAQEATVAQLDASVRAAEVQLEKSVLRSPIDGIVTRQEAKVGGLVTANQTVAAVISAGRLEIEANVPEVDIAKLAVGNEAIITLDAYGKGVMFPAHVIRIDPAETVIEGVSTYITKFSFEQEDARLKPGMTADIAVTTAQKTNVLIIPERAVMLQNGKRFVQRMNAEGRIEEREITTGIRDTKGNVEVVSGLAEGDVIEE
ncbi:MAG: efflux RND transporter periplasmic adaptor subunit [Candidatus Liptonbacteria bacterium]|nr:efflux RND transporter periplasmic adaptor subunit [Candidatus Liptonbacteria bacterium]